MNWYIVDEEYINYLLQFDPRVGFINYGDKLKLHVGTVLSIDGHHYYVPISSAKPKHHKMSNSLDFQKLKDSKTGYLYAILNLNNMIPVPDCCLTQLKYTNVSDYRSFSSDKERTNYIYLLQKEKRILDEIQDVIQGKAQKLYVKCLQNPNSTLAKRCCNFKLLEEKAVTYKLP